MVSYSTMALNGRIAAAETAHQPHRAVTEYRWREEPDMRVVRYPAAPPFTDGPTVRREPTGTTHWEIEVFLSCGHRATWLAYGVPREGYVPPSLSYRYAIGKKKRCTDCPPVEPKPAPPDVERCTGEDGGEEAGWRRCRTRARWAVIHVAGDGTRGTEPVDRLCERHRRQAVDILGTIRPEPLPYPHGYTDGGWDVVEEIPRPKKEPTHA